MTAEKPLIYWDACVFLSYLNGITDRLQHIDPMLQQSGKAFQIITSVLSITEVAFALTEQNAGVLNDDIEDKINQLWEPASPVLVVEFYELIAHAAKQIMRDALPRGWKLKPLDAIHLATAKKLNAAQFHTYDQSLDKYAAITGLNIGRPIAGQPTLALPPSTSGSTS